MELPKYLAFVNSRMNCDEVLCNVYDVMRCDPRYVELLMRYTMMPGLM